MAGFFVFWLLTILNIYLAHRTLRHQESKKRRRKLLVAMIAPATAMRSAEELSRDLLCVYHPLGVAAAICEGYGAEFEEFARRALLKLHYPTPTEQLGHSPASSQVDRWYRSRVVDRIHEMVRGAGLDPDQLVAQPAALPDAVAYCPRCHGQFIEQGGVCDDCQQLPTHAFEDSTAPATESPHLAAPVSSQPTEVVE